MKKLNLQLFATEHVPSAVKGSRLFISATLPISIDSEIEGVMETSEKGSSTNKIDATTIKDTAEKQALGTTGATEVSFTFALSDAVLTSQTALIKKQVWVYEEIEDTSANSTKFGKGVLMKVELGGITFTGQSSNSLRQITQEGVLVSDDYYLAVPTYEEGSQTPTFVYTEMNSGKVVTLG